MKGEIFSILAETHNEHKQKKVENVSGKILTTDDLKNGGYEFLLYTGNFYIYKKDNVRYLLSKNSDGSFKNFIKYSV